MRPILLKLPVVPSLARLLGVLLVTLSPAVQAVAQDSATDDALLTAVQAGHVEQVRAALAAGSDPNARHSRRGTPLAAAAVHGHTAVVRLLLEAGAAVSLPSVDGWTALHEAADEGHPSIVQGLLAYGASPNALITEGEFAGWTPLMIAARASIRDSCCALARWGPC